VAATVRLGKKLGLSTVAATARKFGLRIPDKKLLARMLVGTDDVSIAELTQAYASFPNGGLLPHKMYAIERIEDAAGLTRYHAESFDVSKRVTTPQNAFLMHSLLQSSLRKGTGKDGLQFLNEDPSTAGKTGTTYDFADNWFVGYNSKVTCSVWTGFLHGKRDEIYPGAFSRETILPVWVDAMNAAQSQFKGSLILAPPGIVRLDICKDSGLRKTRYCQDYKRDVRTGKESYTSTAYTEYFLKGFAPSAFCNVHGVVDPTLAQGVDLSTGSAVNMTSHAIPIQPSCDQGFNGSAYTLHCTTPCTYSLFVETQRTHRFGQTCFTPSCLRRGTGGDRDPRRWGKKGTILWTTLSPSE